MLWFRLVSTFTDWQTNGSWGKTCYSRASDISKNACGRCGRCVVYTDPLRNIQMRQRVTAAFNNNSVQHGLPKHRKSPQVTAKHRKSLQIRPQITANQVQVTSRISQLTANQCKYRKSDSNVRKRLLVALSSPAGTAPDPCPLYPNGWMD